MKIADTLLNNSHQDVTFGDKGRKELLKGAEILYKAVKSTMGPSGHNVIIDNGISPPFITKDGVTVAKNINLRDKLQSIGADLIKEVALKSNEICGDGPQPLYAKVLTPTGWTTMGNLKVGDSICGTNGSIQKVLGIFDKGTKTIFKFKFADGRKETRTVECSEDHLWTVETNYRKIQTITAKEIFEKYKNKSFFIKPTAVEFTETKELPLDPYLLGALLGDGSLSEKHAVELAVNINQNYILDNLKLPNNCKLYRREYKEKNYIKGVINGCDYSKPTKPKGTSKSIIKNILKDLNLLGKNSFTKFIPKEYLFSSIENRRKLLNGLIDTDGTITHKGNFEISTVSEQLYLDIIELCKSLGIRINFRKINRKPGDGSYSTNSIYRITELRSKNRGLKIIDVEKTNKQTEMMCIKVSNNDHLYITDDFVPTHNTSTSVVLAYNLFNNGYKMISSGRDSIHLKKGMDWACNFVLNEIKSKAIQVRNDEDIISVGTISANGDREIGELLCEAIKKVGEDGIITVEKAKSVKTTLSVTDGLSLDSGYISPYFVTNQEKLTSELENPYILITNKKITSKEQLIPAMSIANEKSRPLLVIADEIEQEALHMMLSNKMHGAVISCAVKAPSYGDNRIDILQDLALVTGAVCFDATQSVPLEKLKEEHLGSCEKVTVSKLQTTIVGLGKSVTKDSIDLRISELKTLLNTPVSGMDDLRRNNIKKRLAKLAGGVAVINVGGSTEVEIIEKKDRVDDALNATLAAVQEGILPGGGTALFYASQKLLEAIKENNSNLSEDELFGVKVVYEACQSPLKVIVENTGKNSEVVINEILRLTTSKEFGYDASKHNYCNLIDVGVIDPVKVARHALEFANSVVGLILTCNSIISTPEEVSKIDSEEG